MATLAEMYPGRFWAALGSGEAVNEHITGDRWPDKATRDARLLECVDVIRALLRRRGGHPPRPRHRRPGPAVVAPVDPAGPLRRRGQRGHGPRRSARGPTASSRSTSRPTPCAGCSPPSGRAAARASRRCSRSICRGPRRRPRPWPSPTTSGAATCSRRSSTGTSSSPSSSTSPPPTSGPKTCSHAVLVSADPGRHAARAARARRPRLRRDLPAPRRPGPGRAFIDTFGAKVVPELR